MSSYQSILDELAELPVLDTHEHLPNEEERVAQEVDFTTLFSHYCRDDLIAAGMSEQHQDIIYGSASVAEKWQLMEPLLLATGTSGYMRAAYLAMDRFYGMKSLRSLQDAELLTERVKAANKPGLYNRVLRDVCHIRRSMNYVGGPVDREFFEHVLNIGAYTTIGHMQDIIACEKAWDRSLPTLQRYEQALLDHLQTLAEGGLKGFKIGQAYMRPLDFTATTQHEAEQVFNRIFKESKPSNNRSLGDQESKPLEDYLTRRVIELAGDLQLPVVIHVGFQTFRNMKLDDARPHRLWELIRRYRSVRFSMLHGGLPWVEEGAVMARQLPNLSIDMGWMHIMCPEMAINALKYYFDMVPMHKVMGFGGDYQVVEKVYGHLQIARQNIAIALAERMDRQQMSLEQARRWCRALVHDSANSFFQLQLSPIE
ncbi:MAG: amidohydrolase family protein [Anaerolineaceae bacterium]|nr:amidohydrolase family protein [Anaerolineaceae bacterium]